MAAPAEMSTLDISGKFIMNKTLSDSTDDILRLQGVGWFMRKAIQVATIYLSIRHYKDDDGIERIDIQQTASGGISGTTEERHLDNEIRESEDHIFGPVRSHSKRVRLDELENEFLREGWLEDVKTHGAVWTCAMSDTPKSRTSWTAEQTWGFEDVNGERRYTRHVNFTGPGGENIRSRLYYDYQGPL